MLMNHSDAQVDRVSWCSESDDTSAYPNRTGVWRLHPVRDSHQRRLARPVLAEERVHRAGSYRQRCVVKRTNVAEALANVLECKRRRRVGHNPVGAAMNVDGMSNVVVRCSATARTPSVSVA
jgi:hypothetical protein